MVRNKLLLALLLAAAQCLPAASFARAEDPPYFTAWMLQVYRANALHQMERLPCRSGTACASLGRSASKAHHRKRGTVDPLAKRRKVKAKGARRVQTASLKGSVAEAGSQVFAMPPGFLVLNDAGGERLGVDIDDPAGSSPQVDALAGYVDDLQRTPPPRTVADATGGVGDSAYGALYDFDDESGGETQRGFVEIPSVLTTPAETLAAVPEPGTLLLCGAGLLGWRVRRLLLGAAAGAPRIA